MVNSKILKFYILFLVIFSFVVSSLNIGEETDFSLTKYTFVQDLRNNLNNTGNTLFTIFNYVLIPFLILDVIIILVTMLTISFSTIPVWMSTIIITPLILFIVIDYIIPAIRGN